MIIMKVMDGRLAYNRVNALPGLYKTNDIIIQTPSPAPPHNNTARLCFRMRLEEESVVAGGVGSVSENNNY